MLDLLEPSNGKNSGRTKKSGAATTDLSASSNHSLMLLDIMGNDMSYIVYNIRSHIIRTFY